MTMTNPSVDLGASMFTSGRDSTRSSLRTNPAVRNIVTAWRELTDGGAPTLIACSGGSDSVALALALWSAKAPIALGHVVHDLRPSEEALADRDLTRRLAEALGRPFIESSVRVAGQGNDEGVARVSRYAALASMASGEAIPFIASGHHADDQLESMLMAIARGSGLEGLSGVAASREIEHGVTLIRPMLWVCKEDTKAICRAAGVEWAHDTTNDDTDRFRSAVRAGPARKLTKLRPEAPASAVRAGDLLRDAALLVQDRVEEVFGEALEWDRKTLRGVRAIVLGAGLRDAALRMTGGVGADQFSRRVIDPVTRAIRDDSTEPRDFHWPHGIRVVVTAHQVALTFDDNEDRNDA